MVVRHKDISYSALKERIRIDKARGANTDHDEVRLNKKFSIPFACLIFGVLGGTLGIKSNRSGKSGGMIISIFVIALYYITIVFSQKLGTHDLMDPSFSMWIPNIWLFALTFYLTWKTIHESPFTFFIKLGDSFISGYEFVRGFYLRLSSGKQNRNSTSLPFKNN